MEYAGFVILGLLVAGWLVVMIVAAIQFLPYGLIVLVALLGFGLLLAKVIRDRLANKEDDHYAKTVDQ